MATNDYVFVDRFVAPCNKEAAYAYIKRIEEYPRWWGRVYKNIIILQIHTIAFILSNRLCNFYHYSTKNFFI